MDERRTGGHGVWTVMTAAAALLASYAGAYYATVRPAQYQIVSAVSGVAEWSTEIRPHYKIERTASCFAPMHWLDRRVRRHFWTEAGYVQRYVRSAVP